MLYGLHQDKPVLKTEDDVATRSEMQMRIALKAQRMKSAASPSRRKCFISYHVDDATAVEQFLDDFDDAFIPKVIGVSDYDDFIDSQDPGYIMRRVREKYLSDSTVTIVLLGKCTWARKFIDWEIAATLRNDPVNRRSGLLGIWLPQNTNTLPARFEDNWRQSKNQEQDDYYARLYSYPGGNATLRSNIDSAYGGRDERADTINNGRALFTYNRSCQDV